NANNTCYYCVANPKARQDLIQKKLDFCCGYIPESCDLIQPGGPCYVPDNRRATASYVFNDWFLGGAECNFDGAEIMTTHDPSNSTPSPLLSILSFFFIPFISKLPYVFNQAMGTVNSNARSGSNTSNQ
ncbi:Glucan endo-1 3-beta-glucosidase 4, partial [Bienertia sinuspersici]